MFYVLPVFAGKINNCIKALFAKNPITDFSVTAYSSRFIKSYRDTEAAPIILPFARSVE